LKSLGHDFNSAASQFYRREEPIFLVLLNYFRPPSEVTRGRFGRGLRVLWLSNGKDKNPYKRISVSLGSREIP